MAAVPSRLSLSTTRTEAGANRWFRIASRVSRSTPERFRVTTTAATSGRATCATRSPWSRVRCQRPRRCRAIASIGRSEQFRQAHRWEGRLRGRAYGAVRRLREGRLGHGDPGRHRQPQLDHGQTQGRRRPLRAADHPGGDRDQGELGGQGRPGQLGPALQGSSGLRRRGSRPRATGSTASRPRQARPPTSDPGRPGRRWPPAQTSTPATASDPATPKAGGGRRRARRARNNGQPSRAMGRAAPSRTRAASTSGTVAQMPAAVTANRTGPGPGSASAGRRRPGRRPRWRSPPPAPATRARGAAGLATANPMTAAAARARPATAGGRLRPRHHSPRQARAPPGHRGGRRRAGRGGRRPGRVQFQARSRA